MSLLFVCSNTLLYKATVLCFSFPTASLFKDESASISLLCPYLWGFIDENDITVVDRWWGNI